MKKIGIIGGGQLGMMLCEAAHELGFSTVILDPNKKCSSAYVAESIIESNFDDINGYRKLAEKCDIITYEFENVPYHLVKQIMIEGANVPQTEQPLYITQHRLREKNAVTQSGLKTVPFATIKSIQDLLHFFQEHNTCILKTCFGGYDGKGQWLIKSETDIFALSQLFQNNPIEFIAEKKINLKQEISCIVHRNNKGKIVCQPIAENVHKNGILFHSTIPATIDIPLKQKAEKIATQLMLHLNFIGTLAVEMFIDNENEIFINELAPRPHNSGHHTIEACEGGQFINHILSITNQDLIVPTLKDTAFMLNIIGDEYQTKQHLFQKGFYHDYFKDIKPNRKMAHITFLGSHPISILD